jgi:hypothetical protein
MGFCMAVGLRSVERPQMLLPSVIVANASQKIYISISATELPRAKVGMT